MFFQKRYPPAQPGYIDKHKEHELFFGKPRLLDDALEDDFKVEVETAIRIAEETFKGAFRNTITKLKRWRLYPSTSEELKDRVYQKWYVQRVESFPLITRIQLHLQNDPNHPQWQNIKGNPYEHIWFFKFNRLRHEFPKSRIRYNLTTQRFKKFRANMEWMLDNELLANKEEIFYKIWLAEQFYFWKRREIRAIHRWYAFWADPENWPQVWAIEIYIYKLTLKYQRFERNVIYNYRYYKYWSKWCYRDLMFKKLFLKHIVCFFAAFTFSPSFRKEFNKLYTPYSFRRWRFKNINKRRYDKLWSQFKNPLELSHIGFFRLKPIYKLYSNLKLHGVQRKKGEKRKKFFLKNKNIKDFHNLIEFKYPLFYDLYPFYKNIHIKYFINAHKKRLFSESIFFHYKVKFIKWNRTDIWRFNWKLQNFKKIDLRFKRKFWLPSFRFKRKKAIRKINSNFDFYFSKKKEYERSLAKFPQNFFWKNYNDLFGVSKFYIYRYWTRKKKFYWGNRISFNRELWNWRPTEHIYSMVMHEVRFYVYMFRWYSWNFLDATLFRYLKPMYLSKISFFYNLYIPEVIISDILISHYRKILNVLFEMIPYLILGIPYLPEFFKRSWIDFGKSSIYNTYNFILFYYNRDIKPELPMYQRFFKKITDWIYEQIIMRNFIIPILEYINLKLKLFFTIDKYLLFISILIKEKENYPSKKEIGNGTRRFYHESKYFYRLKKKEFKEERNQWIRYIYFDYIVPFKQKINILKKTHSWKKLTNNLTYYLFDYLYLIYIFIVTPLFFLYVMFKVYILPKFLLNFFRSLYANYLWWFYLRFDLKKYEKNFIWKLKNNMVDFFINKNTIDIFKESYINKFTYKLNLTKDININVLKQITVNLYQKLNLYYFSLKIYPYIWVEFFYSAIIGFRIYFKNWCYRNFDTIHLLNHYLKKYEIWSKYSWISLKIKNIIISCFWYYPRNIYIKVFDFFFKYYWKIYSFLLGNSSYDTYLYLFLKFLFSGIIKFPVFVVYTVFVEYILCKYIFYKGLFLLVLKPIGLRIWGVLYEKFEDYVYYLHYWFFLRPDQHFNWWLRWGFFATMAWGNIFEYPQHLIGEDEEEEEEDEWIEGYLYWELGNELNEEFLHDYDGFSEDEEEWYVQCFGEDLDDDLDEEDITIHEGAMTLGYFDGFVSYDYDHDNYKTLFFEDICDEDYYEIPDDDFIRKRLRGILN